MEKECDSRPRFIGTICKYEFLDISLVKRLRMAGHEAYLLKAEEKRERPAWH